MPVTEPEGLMTGYLGAWPWPGPAKVVVVRGWAIDWDAPMGGYSRPRRYPERPPHLDAGHLCLEPRPDVDAAFPETRTPVVSNGIPAGHGYVMRVPTIPNSTAVVCAVAINRGGTPGDNTILGCETVAT